ncbi:TVP38/TMEM64 family protein [Paenibacillus eucommiae]|uniref:TVP38/TMEM64 family membrane protein n=1 Tax=Paenibacillus eucommiae TaxID=1355755 RepID=A0ABS4IQ45_9BACL|nr:TVP38/TMEM64 family protein [Paenibacillus eucommiae]MBP1989691.1 putative membrane protein YdjX (TVP38/TMEM64 family) [Paenibacillus eucommiae]
MINKWLLVLGYVITIIVIILNKDPILRWLDDDSGNNFILLFGAAVLLALVPVVPYGIVAGLIGAKYGPFLGGFLNVMSSTIAAALLFLSVRLVFQKQGIKLMAKFKRLDRFTELMERNAFIAVLTARLIPFVPAVAVNVYTAISRIRFRTFAAATCIGKIPVMFVFAVIGDQLLSDLGNVLWASLIYIFFLSFVFLLYWWYRKRSGNKSKSTFKV